MFAVDAWCTAASGKGSALKSTASRRPLPTPLHQYPSSNLSGGLIGSDECPEAVEQLQLLVRRADVAHIVFAGQIRHVATLSNLNTIYIQLYN